MTKAQFRLALEQLGLTQGQAAKLWKKSINTVNNWATGRWPVPAEIAQLLEAWLKHGRPS